MAIRFSHTNKGAAMGHDLQAIFANVAEPRMQNALACACIAFTLASAAGPVGALLFAGLCASFGYKVNPDE